MQPKILAGHWYGGYRANTAFCHHVGRDFANKNGGRLIVLAQSSNRGIERRFRFSVVKSKFSKQQGDVKEKKKKI